MMHEELDVEACYHQFFLAPIDTTPVYDGRDTGPIASIVDDSAALIVSTGCTDGRIELTISLVDAAPPADDAWEVQEAVSITIDEPLYLWAPTGGFTIGADARLWCLEPDTSGPHRVRVSARGRGDHYAEFRLTSPATEHYLIQAWPEDSLRPREMVRDDGFGIGA